MNTNSEYQKKLLKKWGAILESGSTRIGSVQGKLTVAQLLEHTHRDFVKHYLHYDLAREGTAPFSMPK